MSRAAPIVTAAGARLARIVELGGLVGERRRAPGMTENARNHGRVHAGRRAARRQAGQEAGRATPATRPVTEACRQTAPPRSGPRTGRPRLGPQARRKTPRTHRLRPGSAGRGERPTGVANPPRSHERAGPHDPLPEQRRHQRRGRLRRSPRRLPLFANPCRRLLRTALVRRLGRPRPAGPAPAGLVGRGRRADRRADRRHPPRRPGPPEGAAHPGRAAGAARQRRQLLAGVPGREAATRGPRLAVRDPRHRQEDRVRGAAVQLRHAAHAGGSPRPSGQPAHRPDPAEGGRGRRPRLLPGDAGARSRCTRPTSR